MLSTVDARGVPGAPRHSLQALASEPGSVVKVGRHPDSNVILEHPDFPYLISRRHAEYVHARTRLALRCVLRSGF